MRESDGCLQARAAAANLLVGLGLRAPAQALTGVRVSSYQTRIKKHQGHREVHILTTPIKQVVVHHYSGATPTPFPQRNQL